MNGRTLRSRATSHLCSSIGQSFGGGRGGDGGGCLANAFAERDPCDGAMLTLVGLWDGFAGSRCVVFLG